MTSFIFSAGAAFLLLASITLWVKGAKTLQLTTGKRTAYILALSIAAGSGIAGLLTATNWLEYSAAAVPVLLSLVLLYLIYHSRQSSQPPAVKVGDAMPDFTARDENGDDFTISSLHGSAYILKFYRGHWCPYCIAELSVWGKMTSELKALGVQKMVYISTDEPADIRKGLAKHNAEGIQLSDPQLKTAKLFDVVNRGKNITPPSVKAPGMPIPTTILVDAQGIVRWIDQASDYQLRASKDRVFAAVRSLGL